MCVYRYVCLNVQVPTSIIVSFSSAMQFYNFHYTTVSKQTVVDHANHKCRNVIKLTAYFQYVCCMEYE